MLTGLNLAWFAVYRDAQSNMQTARIRRHSPNWGILKDTDRWALEFQYWDARADHAKEHLEGSSIIHHHMIDADGFHDLTQESRRDSMHGRIHQKRQALKGLKPIWEREEQEDLNPSPY